MPATYVISSDTFSRGNQSGWGTASDKETWSQPVGTGAISIVSNRGQVTTNTGSSVMLLGSYMDADLDIRVRFSLSNASNDYAGAVLRYQNSSNYFFARVQNNTLSIVKVIGGVTTVLAPTASVSIANSTNYWLHVSAFDSTYLVNVYADGQQEPSGWMLTCVDASITGIGNYGLYAFVNASADTILFDSFQALIIPQLIVTIGEKPVRIDESTLQITYRLDERMRAQFNVLDYTASTFFSFGQKVVMTDPTLGTIFTGFVLAVKQDKSNTAPDPTIEHQMDTVDNRHLLDKRRSQKLYVGLTTNTILADLLGRYATQEGVSSTFALSWAELQTEWEAAVLTNTTPTTNASTGNVGAVDLELPLAGTSFTYTGSASVVTNQNALHLSGYASSGYNTAYTYRQIWSGSQVITTGDTFSYNIWISSTSPALMSGVEFICSDGTRFTNNALTDLQGLGNAPTTDLSGLANDQWYSRSFTLPSALNSKTIINVQVFLAGTQAGTYDSYFRNIYYHVASPPNTVTIFDTSSTLTTNVQAATVGYSNVSLNQVTAGDKSQTIENVVGGYGSVGLVQSSIVQWTENLPVGCSVVVETSIDNGGTFQVATNGGSIPNLLAGMVAASYILVIYTIFTFGTDPTAQPSVTDLQLQINPAYVSGKNDVSALFLGQTDFQSGTLTNAVWPMNSNSTFGITLNGYQVSDWENTALTLTQYSSGTSSNSALNKQLSLTSSATSAMIEKLSVGNWQNLIAEIDVTVVDNQIKAGFVYRCTALSNNDGCFAYAIELTTTGISLRRGQNNTAGGASVQIGTLAVTLAANSLHRIKLVVNGSTHQVYLDGAVAFTTTDSTWSTTGAFGIRFSNADTSTKTLNFGAFGICAALSGSWQSPSISIAGATTYGGSLIQWDINNLPDNTTSIGVQTSVDGGSTWQSVTNGGTISNLTVGQSLSGKSLLLLVTLIAQSAPVVPQMQAITVWVLGQYESIGTRSTAPLGNDQFIRTNQSGWGTSTDQQTYTEQGSATLAISSNTGTVSGTGGAHIQLGSQTSTDESVMITFSVGNTASQAGAEARYTNSSGTITAYRAYAQSGNFTLDKRVSGTLTTLQTVSFTLATSTNYTIRLVCQGTTIQARIWQTSTSEPTTWQLSQIDSSIANGGIAISASNASGDTIAFTRFLGTIWPDPTLSLSGAGRATSSVASHNSVLTANTRVDMLTSIDGGATYQPVANPGDLIPGIGLMAHYTTVRSNQPSVFCRLNEQSGSIAYDSSNNSYNGSIIGGVTLGEPGGLVGVNESSDTAMLFDGSTGYIALPSAVTTNGLSAFSVECWVLPAAISSDYGRVIANGDVNSSFEGFQIGVNPNAGGAFFAIGNGTTRYEADDTTSLSTTAWTQLVGVWTGSAVQLYVNGTLIATTPTSGSLGTTSFPINLGRSPDGNSYYAGQAQACSLYPTALTQAKITALYNAGAYATTGTYDDNFAVNSSSNYTQTFGAGGAAATWTWDTTNSRLIASGGTKAQLLYNNVLAGEVDVLADYFQSENGGLIWCWQDSSDYYELIIKDSGAASNPNSLTLNKVSGGTSTQLATTSMVFPSQTYKRFHVTMMAGIITVYLDGSQMLTYTDGSPFGAGLMGVRNDTGTSYLYDLQLTQLPPDLSSKAVYSKLILSTTDPTATPQVLSFATAAFGPQIDAGITLPAADYRDTLVSSNIDDLAKQSNHSWYVDSNASVWFKETQGIPSPWIAQSSNGLSSIYGGDIEVDSNLEVDVSGDLYRNRQTLTHVSLTNNYTESFVGDGFRRTFTLSYKVSPGDVPTIIVDGVRQTIGVKGATGFQWYYKEDDQTLEQDKSQRILKSFDSLTVSYTGYSTTTVTVDNVAAQAALAAQEGGTGIIEQVTDSKNMPYAAALVLAQQLLDFYSLSGRTIIFKTYRNGLMVGQILTVYLPEENLHGVRMYIIEVDLTMQTLPGNQRLYGYLVTATELPNTKSWQKLLASGLVDPTTGS